MFSKRFEVAALGAVVALTLAIGACGAKTYRDQARVGAKGVGELALAIDKQERDLYAANLPGYDKAAHLKVGDGIYKMLVAVQAYERAAKQLPESGASPTATVDAAKMSALAALDSLVAILPQIAGIRDPLLRAVAAVRAALAPPQARLTQDTPVQQSGAPYGGSALIWAEFITAAIAGGRITFEAIKGFFKSQGVSDEELDALDARLSDAIAARKAEADAEAPPKE
jgi:hypothetical protein